MGDSISGKKKFADIFSSFMKKTNRDFYGCKKPLQFQMPKIPKVRAHSMV